MAGSLRQLTSRQLERLKSELAEVIIANFCYPAFLDYRLNMLRTRPVDRRKRQEVWAYVSGVNFSPIGSMDVGSMDFRRFVERVFLRYVDMNRALMATASARQIGAARARVPQLAMSVGRGLADYLVLSEASTFGQARLVESWGTTRSAQHEPAWEQIEKSTQVLQTTLVYLHTANAEKATLAAAGADRVPTDEASFPDISSYPTKMLHPLEPDQRPTSAGATNGASSTHSHPMGNGNGAHLGLEEVSLFPDLLEDDDAGVRGQFRGPRRSPTSSRPVDRPPALPPLMPAADVPSAPKDTTSRPIQPPFAQSPAPAYEPPPAPQPTRAYEPPPAPPPTPVYQPPVASQPPPAPQPPVPASPAESSDDIWQELLMRGEAAPASAGPREKTPAALPVEKTPPTLPEQPDPDLLDLPESFSAPRLLELPPDLAELYGDYLRDSRAANIDLAAAALEPPPAEEQVQPAAEPLPTSETDEEVDALFTALTNQIAAKEQSERSAHLQQSLGPQAPEALFPPDEPWRLRKTATRAWRRRLL